MCQSSATGRTFSGMARDLEQPSRRRALAAGSLDPEPGVPGARPVAGGVERHGSERPLQPRSGRRASNPRPRAWEARALPTELRPRGRGDSSAGLRVDRGLRSTLRERVKALRSPVAIAVIVAVVALMGLLAYGLSQSKPDRGIDQALARGERKAAPSFDLPMLTGTGRASLTGYRGKVVVLNFWASWCEPCRTESPLLERWHRRMAGRGGTVLGVDVLDVASDARAFARKYGLSYPMARDGDGNVLGPWGGAGYPETFGIDRRGRIAATQRGRVDDAFMRARVAPLLRERS